MHWRKRTCWFDFPLYKGKQKQLSYHFFPFIFHFPFFFILCVSCSFSLFFFVYFLFFKFCTFLEMMMVSPSSSYYHPTMTTTTITVILSHSLSSYWWWYTVPVSNSELHGILSVCLLWYSVEKFIWYTTIHIYFQTDSCVCTRIQTRMSHSHTDLKWFQFFFLPSRYIVLFLCYIFFSSIFIFVKWHNWNHKIRLNQRNPIFSKWTWFIINLVNGFGLLLFENDLISLIEIYIRKSTKNIFS